MIKTSKFSVYAPSQVQFINSDYKHDEVLLKQVSPEKILQQVYQEKSNDKSLCSVIKKKVLKSCVICEEHYEEHVLCTNCSRGICLQCLDDDENEALMKYKEHTPCGCGFEKICTYCKNNELKREQEFQEYKASLKVKKSKKNKKSKEEKKIQEEKELQNILLEVNTVLQDSGHWSNVFARLCVNGCGEYFEDDIRCLECRRGMCYFCFKDGEIDAFYKYIEHTPCGCGFNKYCYDCEENSL